MSAASTLVAATYWLTAAVEDWSMSQAVYMTSNRNCSIWIHESAMRLLDGLLVGQQASLSRAGQGPLAHHGEHLLGSGDRPHGVVDPPATQASLRHLESLTLAAEQVVRRNPHVLVTDVRVACPRASPRCPTRGGGAPVSPGVSVGTRNMDIPL